ncbi:MAG: substrate-binding domain-containing protein [Beijerinckiaceae bacterium]|nr:substrate-binding domain-containing protein [Beijerinckiaceae bacterium]MCZ8299461.1 substrate-binding domain-containing protein [Beijerinckiaceae bacterium]
MIANRIHRLGFLLLAGLGVSTMPVVSQAAELRVIAPNAVKHAVEDVVEPWARQNGVKLNFTWTGSEAIGRRVLEGEVFDVVITTDRGIDALLKAGKIAVHTKMPFARSAVAVGVGPGIAKPDISTVEGLKAAIRNAKTIAISSGASGRYLEQLFEQLGVANEIKSKLRQPPSGAQIGELLARGDAELGFQQVTELIGAEGFQYVGPLPSEVQNYTVWAAGLHWTGVMYSQMSEIDLSTELVKQLTKPASDAVLRKTGLDPVRNP